jgi:quinoprotein glucose dehydrogenase
VLNRSITQLVETDGKFLDGALSLVLQDKLDISSVPDKAIAALVLNEQLPGPARADALDLYATRKPAGFSDLLVKLAAGKEDDLAIAALRRLVDSAPADALEGLSKATTTGSARRKQEAWKLAATVQAPDTGKLFLTGLADLQKDGGVSPAALELLDAAAKRTEPAVVKELADFKAKAASSSDPLTAFLPSLEGGDPKKGEQTFESHPAGQCMRCHSGGHGGGDAGPNLSGVALRGDRRHFLQSMVEPGAKVAMGYGIASVTLKGGKSVAGIVIADTPEHVDLDSSGKVLRVEKKDIDTMTPPVSSMPPMGMILSASEIRDLVAFLAEQKKETKDEKKRPAPELVKP